MTTIYGINNCDTVKKAQKWLANHNIENEFFDFKKQTLSKELLEKFVSLSSWEKLINKRSTTYRNLNEEIKANLNNEVAFNTVLNSPTLLKRPLLLHKGKLHLGFKDAQYQEIFANE